MIIFAVVVATEIPTTRHSQSLKVSRWSATWITW